MNSVFIRIFVIIFNVIIIIYDLFSLSVVCLLIVIFLLLLVVL